MVHTSSTCVTYGIAALSPVVVSLCYSRIFERSNSRALALRPTLSKDLLLFALESSESKNGYPNHNRQVIVDEQGLSGNCYFRVCLESCMTKRAPTYNKFHIFIKNSMMLYFAINCSKYGTVLMECRKIRQDVYHIGRNCFN
jgi:hypothetical protein